MADSFLAMITPVSTGTPEHPIAPGGPGVGAGGHPIDPGYGVRPPLAPAHPIAPGGPPPTVGGGPIYPGAPAHPIAPGGPPPVPEHPIAGPPPAIWPSPGHPAHPIALPGEPGAPPDPDYGIPKPGGDKVLLLVWVPGVGLKWVVVDTGLKPEHPIVIPPTAPGTPTHPIAPGGSPPEATHPIAPGGPAPTPTAKR